MSTKSLKPTKPPITPPSLSNHLATIELKQRILNSLSRLSDRDTHQIAVDDLETLIKTLSPDTLSILLNSLYAATTTTTTNNNTAVRKEAIRLLSFVCVTHTQSAATHLNKIIIHIVKTLKDSDSGVKDSCRESIGHLSFLYLKRDDNDNNNNNHTGSVVSLFVKPLFDAMNEQNKGVQSGAALCMAKMVEMASDPPVLSFQKLCGRICKLLNSPNFLANAALLPVVSSLSQVGAIAPQFLEPLLQSIHDCLSISDWSTRKAAADTLNALALHSSKLIKEHPTSTISILEACRFDKIKPVRDSITEALQLWTFIAEDLEDQKTHGHFQDSEPAKLSRKDLPKLVDKRVEILVKDGQNILKKSTGTRKKAPPLSDKELNPEFFQRLERRVSGEVEVIVNRRFIKSSDFQIEEETEVNDNDGGEKSKSKSEESYLPDEQVNLLDHSLEREGADIFSRRRELDNEGNLLGIQRQLLQLERQQAHLMNMLQDFKGGSRDGMVTLENRVSGLEIVVEDMARNLSVSMNTLRRSCYANGFHESSERFGKYNVFSNYPNTKLMRNDVGLTYTSRGSSWDYHTHGTNTQMGSRRGVNSRSPKRVRPVRFGQGHVGDMDLAYGEALASGDDLLLVKLLDKTGPLIDQLSSDVASEVLHAVARFLLEPNLFNICLSWIQQLLDTIIENGTDVVGIPLEVKREILVNLNNASSTINSPENWEGLMPNQLLLQLASAWDINLQQLYK